MQVVEFGIQPRKYPVGNAALRPVPEARSNFRRAPEFRLQLARTTGRI